MALMTWNASYSVNVKLIDEQHKKWIDILNELHDAMKSGKGKDKLGGILAELVEYTKVHFAMEERLMQQSGYPHFEGHQRIHADMAREVETLYSRYRAGEPVLSIDVMQFLKNWLSEHIMTTDKNYSPFLNSKGIS
jgi:hemerythrin